MDKTPDLRSSDPNGGCRAGAPERQSRRSEDKGAALAAAVG